MSEIPWRMVVEVEDVTPEILAEACEVFDGWFARSGRIDWTDFFDRLEDRCSELADGTRLDLGNDMNSPAVRRIKRYITKHKEWVEE